MTEKEESNRILEVASEKFFESGITKVTLDEVANDLGMSKKTVYKFFPSKDILLHSVVKMLLSRIEREVTEIVNSDESAEIKLTRILTLVGRQVRHLSRRFQLDIQRFAPSLWTEIDTFRREHIFSRVKQMFEQAKQEEMFRADLNTDLFYLVFISSVQGIMNPKTLSDNSFSAEDAFQQIFRILMEGILTEKGKNCINFSNIFKQ